MNREIFKTKKTKGGYVIIINTLFFIALALVIVTGAANPIVSHHSTAQAYVQSKKAFLAANSAAEETLYRLKTGRNMGSSETITLSSGSAVVSITDTFGGKDVIIQSQTGDFERNVRMKLIQGVGASFNYGVQSGQGGFILENNASVIGNVYSNGNIAGSANTSITGTAIAANSAPLSTNQSNEDAPTNAIVFRDSSSNQDFAQSFQVTVDGPINSIELYIRKVGTPANATIRIVTDSGGNPGPATLATETLSASLITGTYGWVNIPLPNPQVTQGVTYWIVVDNGSSSNTNYYDIGANSAYPSGQAKIGRYGATWGPTSPAGLDSKFRIFLGGVTSSITNIAVGTSGTGDAHAHTVTGSTITGSLYCKEGSGNNKACNTSLPDPAPVAYPISDANIAQWKDEADQYIYNGNLTPAGSTSTLGPMKVIGDLILPSDHHLTVTGTIWVTGNIVMPNNNSMRLVSGYQQTSGAVIADGYIHLENNVDFYGSGQSGSYILLLTTSSCPASGACGGHDAIELANNIGLTPNGDRVVVNAQRGRIEFGNNTKVKSATAHEIYLNNNVSIEYDSGLANVNFSSGPGGSWNIDAWDEIE